MAPGKIIQRRSLFERSARAQSEVRLNESKWKTKLKSTHQLQPLNILLRNMQSDRCAPHSYTPFYIRSYRIAHTWCLLTHSHTYNARNDTVKLIRSMTKRSRSPAALWLAHSILRNILFSFFKSLRSSTRCVGYFIEDLRFFPIAKKNLYTVFFAIIFRVQMFSVWRTAWSVYFWIFIIHRNACDF